MKKRVAVIGAACFAAGVGAVVLSDNEVKQMEPSAQAGMVALGVAATASVASLAAVGTVTVLEAASKAITRIS